jgi:hypothetical protein
LVIVAIIQIKNLKIVAEKGFRRTLFEPELVDPNRLTGRPATARRGGRRRKDRSPPDGDEEERKFQVGPPEEAPEELALPLAARGFSREASDAEGANPRRAEVYPVGEESGAQAGSLLRHFGGSRKRLI